MASDATKFDRSLAGTRCLFPCTETHARPLHLVFRKQGLSRCMYTRELVLYSGLRAVAKRRCLLYTSSQTPACTGEKRTSVGQAPRTADRSVDKRASVKGEVAAVTKAKGFLD